MEFQTVLENRRSVRSYDDSKKVTKEQINEIVEAAIQGAIVEKLTDGEILLYPRCGQEQRFRTEMPASRKR